MNDPDLDKLVSAWLDGQIDSQQSSQLQKFTD